MSPRPRSRSDSDVANAAARVLTRLGADRLRLSDVATESGLAAATLVQRFGSRDGVLQAVGRVFIASVAEAFRGNAASELARLTEALTRIDSGTHFLFFGARPGEGAAYSLELRKHIAFS